MNGNSVRKLAGSSDTYYVNEPDGKTEVVNFAPYGYNYTYNIFGNDNLGQVRNNGGTVNHYYYLKDHLGSIKMTVNSSGTVVGYDDYYPFGLTMPNRSSVSSADARYKFTSKERDSETGYDYFGARYYDSWLGRWLQVDPLASKYPNISPFNYVSDNPLKYVDLKGDSLVSVSLAKYSEFIHGDNSIIIDHRYVGEVLGIFGEAVKQSIHVQVNESFRSLKDQMSDRIQKKGITPAGKGSRHLAGLAIDFNLYKDNNPLEGIVYGNKGLDENNSFVKAIDKNGSRWGGSWGDNVHFDAGLNLQIFSKYNIDFESIRDENQNQFNTGKIYPYNEKEK